MCQQKTISEIEKELYEVLADKTLSFGCRVSHRPKKVPDDLPFGSSEPATLTVCEIKEEALDVRDGCVVVESIERIIFDKGYTAALEDVLCRNDEFEIIGHEPTLSDVLLELSKKWMVDLAPTQNGQSRIHLTAQDIRVFLYDISKSFDNQSDETLRSLHNLICTDGK